MNRRAFLIASLLASTSLVPARAASGLTVIYVGGLDCPPCQRWRAASEAKWLASPEYRKVTWVEVESPKLREAYQERYWPDDLRPILEQLPRKNGTPRFLIVKDGKVVANQLGGSSWATIMTDLKNLLGE